MRYNIIASGSDGNAVVLNDSIMVDCGVPLKALHEVYKDLKLVLLSHIHHDHFQPVTIRRLAQERPTLRFGCGAWLVEPLLQHGVNKKNIDVYEAGKKYDYGRFSISPVELHHDVANFGYKLYFGSEKAIYITDTATVEGIKAPDYDLYLVEANYTDEDLQERIAKKEAAGKYAYEKTVPGRHLSKKQADNFIYENITPKGEYVYLHQHKD